MVTRIILNPIFARINVTKRIRIGGIGDIHLGHSAVPTRTLLSKLDKHFMPFIKTLSALFINGDVYERVLPSDSEDTALIHAWVGRVVLSCIRHNVPLVVIRGTPSHDGDQCQYFKTAYDHFSLQVKNDLFFRYVDTLEIVKLPDIGSFLCLPDKFGTGPADAYAKAIALLEKNGMSQVDYMFMHGGFDFQQASFYEAHPSYHSLDDYTRIVKYAIFTSHIHTPLHKGIAYGIGSFDRTKHGEEHNKGWLVYEIEGDSRQVFAMNNPDATPFVTLDYANEPPDYSSALIVSDIDPIAKKCSNGGYVRLILPKGHALLSHIKPLQERYRGLVIKAEQVKEKKHIKDLFASTPVPCGLNVDVYTLPGILTERLKGTANEPLTPNILEIVRDLSRGGL